jgi:hypothetical protein
VPARRRMGLSALRLAHQLPVTPRTRCQMSHARVQKQTLNAQRSTLNAQRKTKKTPNPERHSGLSVGEHRTLNIELCHPSFVSDGVTIPFAIRHSSFTFH